MTIKIDHWRVGPYSREEGEPPRDLWPSDALVDNLSAVLEGRDDDQKVTLTAGTLRSLLAAVKREGLTRVPGASIRDPKRGVTYNVTATGSEGRVWLRSVELLVDDPSKQPDPITYRVPSQLLADAAALHLAQTEGKQDAAAVVTDEHGNVVVEVEEPRSGPPSTDELAALVKAGETRRTLAARFGRSVITVDGWLAQARREQPESFPRQRRGPKPRTSA